ncbi:MAG: rhodanese-like domain-containing protein [Verrucomicrobiota bacterium]
MWRTLQRALVVTIAGAVLGLAANAVSPRRIPYIAPPVVNVPSDFIPFDEAQALWRSGEAIFLDARAPADYAAGHIGNAFNVPAENFDAHYSPVAGMLTPASRIVTYCDGLECDLSHHLTDRLRQLGYTNVHILKNGWTVWRNAGLATSTGGQP